MLRVLIDTNVLISGLLFSGNEQRLLEHAFQQNVLLLILETVLDETHRVLKRKAAPPFVFELLLRLQEKSVVIALADYSTRIAHAKTLIRDENDAPILAAVLCIQHDFFVSGDADFVMLCLPTHILLRRLLEKIER